MPDGKVRLWTVRRPIIISKYFVFFVRLSWKFSSEKSRSNRLDHGQPYERKECIQIMKWNCLRWCNVTSIVREQTDGNLLNSFSRIVQWTNYEWILVWNRPMISMSQLATLLEINWWGKYTTSALLGGFSLFVIGDCSDRYWKKENK